MNQLQFIATSWPRCLLGTLSFIVCVTSTAADEPIRLRVLSYNIHHAEGVDHRLDLERIASVILSVQPDLVALQEVDQRATRSGSVDQPAKLSELTKMNVVFGGNIPLQGGLYGNALLSRFPITTHKNHRLPNVDNGEQRGVLEAKVAVPGLKSGLLLLNVHLDHRRDDQERVASAIVISKLVADDSHQPALLAGDLNDVVGSQTLRELDTRWTRANREPVLTSPGRAPKRQIDFILFRPEAQWKVVDVRTLDEAVASDHRALFSVLELTPEQPTGRTQ